MELGIVRSRVARVWCGLVVTSLAAAGVSQRADVGMGFFVGFLTGATGFSLIFTGMLLGAEREQPSRLRPAGASDVRLREHTFPRVPLTRRAKPEELDWAGTPVVRPDDDDVVLGEVHEA